jgi:hypothetical protein
VVLVLPLVVLSDLMLVLLVDSVHHHTNHPVPHQVVLVVPVLFLVEAMVLSALLMPVSVVKVDLVVLLVSIYFNKTILF